MSKQSLAEAALQLPRVERAEFERTLESRSDLLPGGGFAQLGLGEATQQQLGQKHRRPHNNSPRSLLEQCAIGANHSRSGPRQFFAADTASAHWRDGSPEPWQCRGPGVTTAQRFRRVKIRADHGGPIERSHRMSIATFHRSLNSPSQNDAEIRAVAKLRENAEAVRAAEHGEWAMWT